MSRVPSSFTASVPSSTTDASVSRLGNVGGDQVGRELRSLGGLGVSIAVSIKKKQDRDRDIRMIDQAQQALSDFINSNDEDPSESFFNARGAVQGMVDSLPESADPETIRKLNSINRNILRQFSGKMDVATANTFSNEIRQFDVDTDIDEWESSVRDDDNLSPINKEALAQAGRKHYGKIIADNAAGVINQSDDLEAIRGLIRIAKDNNPLVSPKNLVSQLLEPAMEAAARNGLVERVNKLAKASKGLIPDRVALWSNMAKRQRGVLDGADVFMHMYDNPGETNVLIPKDPESRDRAYRDLLERGEPRPAVAGFFMSLDNNLPNGMIDDMKAETEEGGMDNLVNVHNTLRVIKQFDSGKAANVASAVGGVSEVAYWAASWFDPGDPTTSAILEIMSTPVSAQSVDQSRFLFTGRSERQGVKVTGRNITQRLNDVGGVPGNLRLVGEQARAAQGLFQYRMAVASKNLGITDATDMEAISESISKKVMSDISTLMVDIKEQDNLIFSDVSVIAEHEKFGVGTIAQKDEEKYANFVQALNDKLKLPHVGDEGRFVPQNAITQGDLTYIPAVDEGGQVQALMQWNRFSGEHEVITPQSDREKFNSLESQILGSTPPEEFDPFARIRYREDMGDISFVEADARSDGQLRGAARSLALNEFFVRIGREPVLERGSPDLPAFRRILDEIIVNVLGYPRAADPPPKEVGGKERLLVE